MATHDLFSQAGEAMSPLKTSRWMLALLVLILKVHADVGWPQFRGPGGNAVALSDGPVHFGLESNLVWSVKCPPGNSSPIITGTNLFLTAYQSNTLWTICYDTATGGERWRRSAPAEKIEPSHAQGSPAAPTPATDGNRVYAYFGSYGLIAYDLSGHEIWREPLPLPQVEFGSASSPLVINKTLVQLVDQDSGSFLIALDARTGRTLWKRDRPGFRRGFATPYLWVHHGLDELIVPGSIWLKSYNVADGSERWTYTGTSRVACSSPVASEQLLFSASWNVGGDEGAKITMPPWDGYLKEHDRDGDGQLARDEMENGPVRERFSQMDVNRDGKVSVEEWKAMAEMFLHAGNAVLAIKPDGEGEISTTHLAWKSTRSLPYVASPVYFDGHVYTVKNGGLFSCYDAQTGEVKYQDERMDSPGDYYASLVAAPDAIYAVSEGGVVTVIRPGSLFEVLARNQMGESVHATPALVDGTIYFRTAEHLHAFRKAPAAKEPLTQ